MDVFFCLVFFCMQFSNSHDAIALWHDQSNLAQALHFGASGGRLKEVNVLRATVKAKSINMACMIANTTYTLTLIFDHPKYPLHVPNTVTL